MSTVNCVEPVLPEKLLLYLKEKEPTEFNREDGERINKKALLQAVPYVGGSLATLCFGNKEKKQFERLQEFYNARAKCGSKKY